MLTVQKLYICPSLWWCIKPV